MRSVPGIVVEDPYEVDTYGISWRKHREDGAASFADPTVTLGDRAFRPFDWAELPRNKMRARRFLRDFQLFQLGRQALTTVYRGPLGDRSLMTLTTDATDKRWIASRHDLASAMTSLHPAFHRAVLRLKFGFEDHEPIRLTPRERECLGWAALGRTSKEIGETLGLTPATVNFFIDGAVGKLSAANRTEAAAKAVALGLISPPR
jgi:DNA-binding CsgD family transcriptional regulator